MVSTAKVNAFDLASNGLNAKAAGSASVQVFDDGRIELRDADAETDVFVTTHCDANEVLKAAVISDSVAKGENGAVSTLLSSLEIV